jgi:hypothetical protein
LPHGCIRTESPHPNAADAEKFGAEEFGAEKFIEKQIEKLG